MTIVLQTLLQKAPDARFLHEMIGCATERLMMLETHALCASFRASAAPSG